MLRAMNFLFRNIKDLIIYRHDNCIANHTYEEHINSIRAGMKIALDNKAWYNKNKCQYMPARMQILRNILTESGLEADPDKIDTILKFPIPGNKRELQDSLVWATTSGNFANSWVV